MADVVEPMPASQGSSKPSLLAINLSGLNSKGSSEFLLSQLTSATTEFTFVPLGIRNPPTVTSSVIECDSKTCSGGCLRRDSMTTALRYWNYLRKQTFVLESYIDDVNWMMNRALFSSHIYLSWAFVLPYFMAAIHIAAALRAPYSGYPIREILPACGLLLSGCLATCTLVELVAMWNLTKVEVQLCNMLSPEGPRVSLRSYNWGLVFLAMLVDNFLYPISATRSHLSQTINWSGIRYHLKNGRVCKIERLNEKGSKYSDLGGKHLYGRKPNLSNGSFLRALSESFQHWNQPRKET